MNQRKTTAASIQPYVPCVFEDNFKMRDNAWDYAQQAAQAGAKLIVLPEFFNVMGMNIEQSIEQSSQTDELLRTSREFCRKHECHLLLPLFEKRRSQLFNTAHLIDPAGDLILTYDKTHPTVSETEDYGITAGNDFPIVDTPLGRIGVMICYDVYFPETARILSLKGAEIILFPSLQRSDREESVLIMTRVRAMDSFAYVIRSSFGQPKDKPYEPGMMFGGSCIMAPDGSVLANAQRHEGFAIAEIDTSKKWSRPRCGRREPMPVREFLTEDRRPELYDRIIDPR